MGKIQDVSTLSPSRSEESGNNCRKRGIHRRSTKIYDVPPTPTENHNGAIYNIHIIFQGVYNQRYKLEGLAQDNIFLTSLNTWLMEELSQMTVTMNAMQAQVKIFIIGSNKPNKVQEEVLLLGLRE